MVKKILNIFLIIVLINTTFSIVSVVAVAPSPGDLLRNKENFEKNQKIPEKIPEDVIAKEKITDVLEGDQKILVKQFKFIGELDFVPIDTLQSLIKEFNGETDIYLKPGSKINSVDGLITNFHTPKSTLLLLVYAFIGEQKTKKLYEYAIKKKLRFFSYGDACLLWKM